MNTSVTETSKLQIVPTSREVEQLATVAGLPLVLARSGDTLVAINEDVLLSRAAQAEELLLDDPVACRTLVTNLEGQWTLNARCRSVTHVRGSALEIVPLEAEAETTRAPLRDLPGKLTAALLSSDARAALCITHDDSDLDFARYDASCAHLEERRVTHKAVISSALPLQFGWSAAAEAFIVLDPCSNSLWRLGPRDSAPTQISTREPSASLVELHLAPLDPWIALSTQNAGDAQISLMHGALSAGAVRWDGVVRLPEGLWGTFRWRPNTRELVGEQTLRRQSRLVLMNACSVTSQVCDLPHGYFSSDLAWSSTGDQVYVASPSGIGICKP